MVRSVPYRVRIVVRGEMTPALSTVFEGLAVVAQPDGTTLVSGELADQAALHGLLATIRDLGLSLVSVETVADLRSEPRTDASGEPDGRETEARDGRTNMRRSR